MNTSHYLFLRNLAHPYMYLFFIYWLSVACEVNTYLWDGRYIGAPVCFIILTGFCAGLWEWCQEFFLKAKFDFKDVYRSVAGSVVAVFTYMINSNLFANYPILYFGVWTSIAMVAISIVLGLRLMYKRKQLFNE